MTNMKKFLISLFIGLNFLAMARVHVPLNYRFFSAIYQPVDTYLSFFSIYQDWVMFAPNPSKLNVYVTATAEFDDGTTDDFDFYRGTELNLLQKYTYGEKYRKLVSEGIRNDDHSYMWPDAARFALRKMKEKNFTKIPVRVHLVRHWQETPPLTTEWRPHGSKTSQYRDYKFYTYEVL